MYSGSQASRSSPGGMPSVKSPARSESMLPPIAAAPSTGCGVWRDRTRRKFRSIPDPFPVRAGLHAPLADQVARQPGEDARELVVLVGRPTLEVLAQALAPCRDELRERLVAGGRQRVAAVVGDHEPVG